MLDSKPLDLGKYLNTFYFLCDYLHINFALVNSKKEKANLLFLRGKCLDFMPEYTKQAEENLSKSIKLMPTKTEAWDALGHVYWKKRDIE